MSNRLYILSNAFLIKVFPFYSMVFTRSYYKGLLLGIVLVDAHKYKLLLFDIYLLYNTYISGGFSGCFSGFFWLVLVFLGQVHHELQVSFPSKKIYIVLILKLFYFILYIYILYYSYLNPGVCIKIIFL